MRHPVSQIPIPFLVRPLPPQAFKKLLTDPADVAGLPATSLGLAAQQAARDGHEGATAESGPWLVTLDFPSYFPVMAHAKNRALREEVYR